MRKVTLSNQLPPNANGGALGDFTNKKVANSFSDARERPSSQGFIVGNKGGTVKVPGKRGWIYIQRVVTGGENVLLQCYVPVDENGDPRGKFYPGAAITPTRSSDTNPTYYTYDELPLSPLKTKRVPLCNYEFRPVGTFSNDSGVFFGDPTGAFIRGYAPDQVPGYLQTEVFPGNPVWHPGAGTSEDCIPTSWRFTAAYTNDETYYVSQPGLPGTQPDFIRRSLSRVQYEGASYGGYNIDVPALNAMNISVGSAGTISYEDLVFGLTMQYKHRTPNFRDAFSWQEGRSYPLPQPPYPTWRGFPEFWIEVPDEPPIGPDSGNADPNYYSNVGTLEPRYMPSQPAAVMNGQLWNDGTNVRRFDQAIKDAARLAGNTSPDAGWEIVSGATSAIYEEYSSIQPALLTAVTGAADDAFAADELPYFAVWVNPTNHRLELAASTNQAVFGQVVGIAVGTNADGSRMQVMAEGPIIKGGALGNFANSGILYMGPTGRLKLAFENLAEGRVTFSPFDTTVPIGHDSNQVWQPMGFTLGGQDIYIRVGEAVLR